MLTLNLEITHVTIGYPRRPMMEVLGKTSVRAGFNFVALPLFWNRPAISKFEKLSILQNYLSTGVLSDDDIMLFTDAYDVVIVESSHLIISKFLSLKVNLVFNAEAGFWPNTGRESAKEYFDLNARTKWRYLNSGCFIGHVWAIKEFLSYAQARENHQNSHLDDQLLAQDFMIQGAPRDLEITIDQECKIFGSLYRSEDDFMLSAHGILNKTLLTSAGIIHANGDRANEVILHKIQNVILEKNSAAPLDLNICGNDKTILCYDAEQKRIVVDIGISENTMFFLMKGGRRCCVVVPRSGVVTFCPNREVHSGRTTVDTWERLSLRPQLLTCHGILFRDYAPVEVCETMQLQPVPLSLFRQSWCDQLLGIVEKCYETI